MINVDLQGKVAAVTGASSGIGEATARALATAGACVSLGARRVERIAAIAASINDDGGRALGLATDVADEDQARAFIAHTYEHFGRLDILVNNAGVMLLGPVEGADTAEWRRMIDVNVYGLLYCTHAALAVMREQGGGHVVNVSSVAGRRAGMGAAVYNLTKFGVCGFSEALRQEALHASVRVTVIEPGFVDTELGAHNTNPAVTAAIERSREQIGTLLTPEDIAEAIVYAVGQPQHVSINEVLVRPSAQRT